MPQEKAVARLRIPLVAKNHPAFRGHGHPNSGMRDFRPNDLLAGATGHRSRFFWADHLFSTGRSASAGRISSSMIKNFCLRGQTEKTIGSPEGLTSVRI